MKIRSFWPVLAFLLSACVLEAAPDRPRWKPGVRVDAYVHYEPTNAAHRRDSPYGEYWKEVFAGSPESLAEILIVRETWDTEPPERGPGGYQPGTENYSVLVHLRAYGKRIKIEASESAPSGARSRAIAIQRAILRVAGRVERHLAELRKIEGGKDATDKPDSRR